MTKEDLQQIRELLQEQKQEIIQECTANMNIIIESEVTPKLRDSKKFFKIQATAKRICVLGCFFRLAGLLEILCCLSA